MRSRQNCFGSYNQEEDSFTFPIESASNSYDIASGFGSGDAFESMQDDLVPMSAFLGTFLGENQAINGIWNMDFSQ